MKNSKESEHLDGSEIAIIGMAGRFPGARNIDAFWNNLRDGVESITFFTDEQLLTSGVDPDVLNDPHYVKARSVLENVELWDAAFFGVNPREAQGMDPQHRLLLECVWEAIENAGYDTERYGGRISIFAGSGMSSYLVNNIYANPEAMTVVSGLQALIMNCSDSLATHIAYKLNLKGPSYSVQSFCSTSLVAVHLACQCLLNFESDMAVAGGVSIFVPQNTGYWYEKGSILSPDGHCRAFDVGAGGMVFGNGLGVVVMKRLEDALADGDHIEAVIKGSATNNDGSLKVGYTAPSVAGQAEVIVEALANADVEPETITYVETHGTGTALGDPAEITALTRVFRSGTQNNGFCGIGSVKTNIGHLDRASGVASLIKTVLALKHKEIPPSLNFEKPNPDIDFENSPFYVNTGLCKWKVDGVPLRAAVSNFGFGGTNAHVVIEEAPELDPPSPSRSYQLLLLSAKTSSALDTATKNLAGFLRQNPHLDLADVAYTLQVGRKAFSHRRIIVSQDVEDAVSFVEAADPKGMVTVYQEKRNPPVVFMFSGQGAQYVNMGLELYRTESVFREEIDRCSEILKPQLSVDLRDILYPKQVEGQAQAEKLKQTSITQPALFIIEYALAKLWMSWGIHPAAMVGHSIGEYVAACLSGVFSLEDALSIVSTRGRLMQQLPAGSMLAVQLSEQESAPFLKQGLCLAAVNAPSFCVVAGEPEDVSELERDLEKRNIAFTPLHTSHAFHSQMMDPILEAFKEHVGQVRVTPPQIPYLSNFTGTWITAEQAMDPNYWARHLRETIRFSDCVRELLKEPNRVLLEVGPGRTLSMLARQHSDGSTGRVVLSSIHHPKEETSDIAFILNTLGRLWLAGVEVDWAGFYKDERRHRLPLPTYPFERQRYWIEPTERPRGFFAAHAGLGNMERTSEVSTGLESVSEYLAPRNPELESTYVAPRNEVEQAIIEIWQELLGIKKICIHDNYFDLGGTSVLAVRLFAQIEKIFDKKLPLAALINAPTVEQLAGIVTDEQWSAQWSSLVTIQPGGSKPPFFFIHGAGGNILNYRDLARHLGPDQPVYGLQAQGLDGNQPFLTRVEDMASRYIQEIQSVQPEGPYFLGGYCLGGTIALEMAQQLYARGQETALLTLLETYNYSNVNTQSLLDNAYFQIQRINFHVQNFLLLKSIEKLIFVLEKLKIARGRIKVWAGMLFSKFWRRSSQYGRVDASLNKLWETNDLAAGNYVLKPCPTQITLFLPVKEYRRFDNPRARWDKLAVAGLETFRLPVYPAGMMVEPFVRFLAEELKTCIDKALGEKSEEKI